MRKEVTELVGGAYSTIRFDGPLIGPGGEIINRLRRHTGASVDLKPFTEPNGQVRIVTTECIITAEI